MTAAVARKTEIMACSRVLDISALNIARRRITGRSEFPSA